MLLTYREPPPLVTPVTVNVPPVLLVKVIVDAD